MTLANAADDIVRHYAPNPEMLQQRIIDVRRGRAYGLWTSLTLCSGEITRTWSTYRRAILLCKQQAKCGIPTTPLSCRGQVARVTSNLYSRKGKGNLLPRTKCPWSGCSYHKYVNVSDRTFSKLSSRPVGSLVCGDIHGQYVSIVALSCRASELIVG